MHRTTSELHDRRRPGAPLRAGVRTALGLGMALVVAQSSLVVAEVAVAEEGATPQAEAAPPPPNVDLDQLLRLPSSYSEVSSRRGGSAAEGWRERFREARGDLDGAHAALAEAQRELETTAADSGQWAVSAPGASDPQNSPVSYRLRQEIREQRENLEKYERSLRALEVEADLKEVPLDWRD